MTQPAGPPPKPPRPYEPQRTNHFVHLALTIVTGGFWIPLWILFGAVAVQADRRERSRHVEETAAFEAELRDWQWRCHQAYGYAPQVPN